MTPRRIMLTQYDQDICISIVSGEPAKARATRFWLSPERANHVAYRLMAYAASAYNGVEKVAQEEMTK